MPVISPKSSANASFALVPLSLRTVAPACMALALVGAGSARAEADADAGATSDIVVTAQRDAANPRADAAAPYKVDRSASDRFTEPLADTPKSVTVIPKEVIQDLGATSFRDLVRTQPGITLGTGEGGNAFGDRIFIRGFDARNDVYIDGLRDPGVTSREIFAVEQVEIVKGPSSSFGGRGTTGGAVNLVSKAPAASNFARGEVVLGTDATRRLSADVNRALGETVQLRVNGMWHDAEVAGRDFTWNRRWGVAAALGWQPAQSISVNLDYYHLSVEGLPDWGHPFDVRSQQPFAVDRDNFYGVLERDFLEGRADIVTLRAVWTASEAVRINSRLRFGSNRNSYIASAPESPVITNPDPSLWTVRANPKNRNATSESWAIATDATVDFATGSLTHSLVSGFELSRELVVNRLYSFANSEAEGAVIVPPIVILHNLFDPDPAVSFPLVRTLSGARNDTKIVSQALYLLDTIDLTPELKLSGGLRFDHYQVNTTSISTRGVITSLANESEFLNWNAGLLWKPVPALSLYLSASTSSNPSGEQSDGNGASYGGLAAATAALDPERNKSFEAGVKYLAGTGGTLLLTAALFRTDKENARVNDPLTAGVQVLAGEQRVDGFEVGVQGNLTPTLSLFGGYTYLDARVLKSPNPAEVGGIFPNIPKHSASLLATWEVVEGVTLGGQALYNSERYGGNVVGGTATLPAYWRFDATARVSVSSKVEVQLNLLNLSDRTYYDAIYRSGTPFAYVAPGRSGLLTLRVAL